MGAGESEGLPFPKGQLRRSVSGRGLVTQGRFLRNPMAFASVSYSGRCLASQPIHLGPEVEGGFRLAESSRWLFATAPWPGRKIRAASAVVDCTCAPVGLPLRPASSNAAFAATALALFVLREAG